MRTALMNEKANLLPGQDLPHLDGIDANLPQVIAAALDLCSVYPEIVDTRYADRRLIVLDPADTF